MKELYVLFNPETSRVKIGISENISDRKRTIELQSGSKLDIVYRSGLISDAYKLETQVHDHFKNERYIGEWFSSDVTSVVEYCESMSPQCIEDREIQMAKDFVGYSLDKDIYKQIVAFAKEYGEMMYKPNSSSSIAKKMEIAKDLKKNGYSVSAIARELNVSRQTIYTYLKVDKGIKRTRSKKEVSLSDHIEELNSDYMSMEDNRVNSEDEFDTRSKIKPIGKGIRVAPNVYKYENCYTYEKIIPGRPKVQIVFSTKEQAVSASRRIGSASDM